MISGEHGIGITKLDFLSDEELAPFAQCKAKVDPHGRFKQVKLLLNRERTMQAGRALEAILTYNDLTNAYPPPALAMPGREGIHRVDVHEPWQVLPDRLLELQARSAIQ